MWTALLLTEVLTRKLTGDLTPDLTHTHLLRRVALRRHTHTRTQTQLATR